MHTPSWLMHVSKPQAAWPRACTRSPTLRSFLGRHSFIGAHNETRKQGWAFRIILQIRELEGMHWRWARDVPPRAWCLGRLSFAPGATADAKNGATSSAKGRHARAWKKSGLATKQQQNPTVCERAERATSGARRRDRAVSPVGSRDLLPRPYRDREQRFFNSSGGGARAASGLGSIGPRLLD